MTAETTFGIGDQVTIAVDATPEPAGRPVVWTITDISVWPGTDVRVAYLKAADGSEYPPRTAQLSRLRPVEDAA